MTLLLHSCVQRPHALNLRVGSISGDQNMARLQRQHPVLHRGPLPKPYLNLKIGHCRRMQRHFTDGGVISSAAVATVSCEMHLQHAPRAAGRKHVKCVCNTYQGAAGWKQQKDIQHQNPNRTPKGPTNMAWPSAALQKYSVSNPHYKIETEAD